MKRLLLFCLAGLSLQLAAQTTVKSSIETVTVFQQGAQIVREASVNLPKGESQLRFQTLPRDLDPNSIILGGSASINVLSIAHNPNHGQRVEEQPEVTALQKQLDALKDRLTSISSEEHGLVLEREVLEQTRQMGGNTGVTLNDIKAATDFARQRREKNAREWYALQKEKDELNKQQAALHKEMQEVRQRLQRTSGEIMVKVNAENAVSANFSLSYIVPNASWTSAYDAKVNDLAKPVNITHKANIVQNTGEDWNNVKLILATGNPSASAQIPYMNTWYVNLNNVAISGNAPAKLRNANAFEEKDMVGFTDDVTFIPRDVQLNQNITQQEFNLTRRQNLLSSPSPVTVVLRELELPAKYEYHAKPRLDPDAFLIAKVYNWGQYDLLDGELSLFNNNTFVGKAFLNTDVPQDTLQLSLGRDKGIVLSRQRVYTKQEKTFFGNNRIDHYVWRIELRNNKKLPVSIVLRDQVPVSQSEEIKVTVKSVGEGEYDEKSGIIKWRLNLSPGQQQSYEVAYEVKYPKEQRVMYY
jgi:uncharacterized protein (TIGR02231 family)